MQEKASATGNAATDPLDPHTWGKKEVAEWVRSVVGAGRKSERLFTPMNGTIFFVKIVQPYLIR